MKFSDFTAKVLNQLTWSPDRSVPQQRGYGWASPLVDFIEGALDIIHDAYGRGVSDAVDSRPDWKGWVEQAALSITKKQEE